MQQLSSLQRVTWPQEPEEQSKHVSVLKGHSVLYRFRCHNPHYTNETHCKNIYSSKACLTEKLAKELMTNFRRSICILALRDKVPFLAKSILISYVKMNTFNIVFVGKWM